MWRRAVIRARPNRATCGSRYEGLTVETEAGGLAVHRADREVLEGARRPREAPQVADERGRRVHGRRLGAGGSHGALEHRHMVALVDGGRRGEVGELAVSVPASRASA